jgi:hypothetical protein
MSTKLTLPPYTYYYGYSKEQVAQLANTPYREAILDKIEASKHLLRRLLAKPFTEQDTARINDVSHAIKFNKQLWDELL